jgi:hypothetical protein
MAILQTWINHPMEYDQRVNLRRLGIHVSGRTVAEILNEASRLLGIKFEPHEEPMWFRAYGIPPHENVGWITDIRITRRDVDILPLTPKRDTAFPIQDSDVVLIYIITD